MYQWWLWAHIVFVGAFLLSHGTSAAVGFRLRQEKSPDAIRELTRLSKQTNNFTYTFLGLILITGISMGFQNNWWRFAWIWVALGVLIIAIGAMNGLSRPYHNIRVGVGLPGRGPQRGTPPAPVSSEQLEQLVAKANPWPISVIGIVAILILIWLMVLKPF
jgi:hypothetical protein